MTEVLTKNPRMSSNMTKRYKDAWDYLFSQLTDWQKSVIKKEPNGRYADVLAHEVSVLAEGDDRIPKPQKKEK